MPCSWLHLAKQRLAVGCQAHRHRTTRRDAAITRTLKRKVTGFLRSPSLLVDFWGGWFPPRCGCGVGGGTLRPSIFGPFFSAPPCGTMFFTVFGGVRPVAPGGNLRFFDDLRRPLFRGGCGVSLLDGFRRHVLFDDATRFTLVDSRLILDRRSAGLSLNRLGTPFGRRWEVRRFHRLPHGSRPPANQTLRAGHFWQLQRLRRSRQSADVPPQCRALFAFRQLVGLRSCRVRP